MNKAVTIALDAMGGDKAPHIVVKGAARFLKKHGSDNIRFLFFGKKEIVHSHLKKYKELLPVSEIRHTDDVIVNDEKPSMALRKGKNSSMGLAIKAVTDGEADYVVSAGNTGALMAIALFSMKRLPGIDRPAIASMFPTSTGKKVIALDLGANLEASPKNLVQYSLLGAIFASTTFGVDRPKVGLLNVGSEEGKGPESVKAASAILKEMENLPADYVGFVEGNDIGKGKVDVVVTDGFTGNIALKMMEGTANLLYDFLKDAFFGTLLSKMVSLLSYFSFKRLKKRMDPRNYNGGMMLGLNGICVKSHGGTDSKGFANAIRFGYKMATNNYNERVSEGLHALGQYGELGGDNNNDASQSEKEAQSA